METDLKLVRKSGFAMTVISLAASRCRSCAALVGQFLPESILPKMAGGRLVPSLFIGTALSISSIESWRWWCGNAFLCAAT